MAAETTLVLTHRSPVQILHIVGDSQFGGAARSILWLAQFACDSSWRVQVLATDPAFKAAVIQVGINVADVNCIWREIRPFKDLVGLIRLYQFLRREKATIVHTHSTKAGFIGRLAARLAGVPIIIHTVHGFAFHERSCWSKIAFYSTLEKLAARCCDHIITVSEFHREWARKLRIAGSTNLFAIPNGTADMGANECSWREGARASLGIPRGDIVLLTHGRLAPEKGLEHLIEAVAQTRGKLNRRLRVVIAGEGPLREKLNQQVRCLALSNEVEFLGFRKDIEILLAAADIVALPSLREGLSIALLEAMSAGRAIIVTAIGSNLEAVNAEIASSSAALVVPVQDSAALSDAIVRLATDTALRAELGRRARRLWERNYTIQRFANAYLETYHKCLTELRC